jgi:hypothetical protein
MAYYKLRVYVNHRPVGFARWLTDANGNRETLLAPRVAAGTKFGCSPADYKDIGLCMADFKNPERETMKGAEPKVTFELIRC